MQQTIIFLTFFLCVMFIGDKTCPAASLLKNAAFPTTINDVSFSDRMENLAAGYEPYKDAVSYHTIDIESEEEYLQRQLDRLEAIRKYDESTLSTEEYCTKYFDENKCAQDRGQLQNVIAIGSASTQYNTTQAQTAGPVVANNRAHKGPCTPSAISNNFTNKILTSGKYATIHPAFEKAMAQIFRAEGECGGHPADNGGYTCYGYAQNFNRDIDVRKLTRPAAEDRTYERFYLAKGLDKLPDAISGDVLRGDFGSGPGQGVKKLQETLGLKKTGIVDDTLIQAVENYNGDIHNAFWNTMQQFYVGITERQPQKKVFLKGWMNMVKLFRDNGCHVQPAQPLLR